MAFVVFCVFSASWIWSPVGPGRHGPAPGPGFRASRALGFMWDAGFRVYGPVGQVEDYIEELKRRVAI